MKSKHIEISLIKTSVPEFIKETFGLDESITMSIMESATINELIGEDKLPNGVSAKMYPASQSSGIMYANGFDMGGGKSNSRAVIRLDRAGHWEFGMKLFSRDNDQEWHIVGEVRK
jgi:hypothetical protein